MYAGTIYVINISVLTFKIPLFGDIKSAICVFVAIAKCL